VESAYASKIQAYTVVCIVIRNLEDLVPLSWTYGSILLDSWSFSTRINIEIAKQNGLVPFKYLMILFENAPLAKTTKDWKDSSPGTLFTLRSHGYFLSVKTT